MLKNAMMLLFAALLLVAGCAVDEEAVNCQTNDDCAISEYCFTSGEIVDENGDPLGECIGASECTDGSCPTGYDCIDGYCKPGTTPPQDKDSLQDNNPPTDDGTVVTDDGTVVTDDGTVVTDDGTVVTDDGTVVTDDGTVVTDDGTVVTDDDSILTEEEPDTDSDSILTEEEPDTDVDAGIFTATFTAPGDAAKTNQLRPDLVITFSRPVDETTLVSGGGCSDPIYVITITPTIEIDSTNSALSVDGKTLTVKLLDDLANNTTYAVNVPDTIQDTSGNYLDKEYDWTFTTDFNPPTATLTTPSPTTDVAVDTAIVLTFSKAMNTASVVFGTSLTIVGDNGAPAVTGTLAWSVGDTVLTFTPDADLPTDTTYTITLTTAVSDAAGNTMTQATFHFSTSDTIAPTVVSTDPVNGTNPAPITTSEISADFSEPVMNVTGTTMTVVNTTDTATVDGTVDLSANGLTATFTPTVPFIGEKLYTITLTTAITDTAGNPMAADYTFTFTTGPDDCGDGYKTGAEACDDGNEADGDYCAADCSATTQPENKVVVTYLGDIDASDWTPETSICPGYTDASGKKCSPSDYAETTTDYTINARKAYVYFDSDSGTNKSGFEIIRSGQVIIKYPDSGTYPADTERLWVLDSNNNIGLITLRILADGIEYNASCSYDHVQISACPSFTHGTVPATCNLEARYQGTALPATVAYPTNRIRTRFISDEETVMNGFQMTANGTAYQTTPYNDYVDDMDQYLDITTATPPTTVIFQNFQTEEGGYGSNDYPGDYMYLYSCPLEQ